MKILRSDFFSIDYLTESVSIPQNSKMHCFFLVEAPFYQELAVRILSELILKGCRSFTFFGAEEAAWHTACDMADIDNNPNWENDTAITVSHDNLRGFYSDLNLNLEIEDPDEPYYFFYDDSELYSKVISKLWYYRIPHKYPKRVIALTSEPISDVTPEQIRGALVNDNSERALAKALAIANNEAGWLGSELDELSDEDYLIQRPRYDDWVTLEKELYSKILGILKSENEQGLANHILGEFGMYFEALPFMERNGFEDGSGWWIEHE